MMMSILPLRSLVIWAALSLFFLTVAYASEKEGDTASGKDTYNLTLASFFNPADPWSQSYTWWARQIEKRSNGRIKIQIFDSGALVDQAAMLPAVRNRRTDIGVFIEAYWPAELPLSQVVSLPFVTRDGEAHARGLTELYRNNEAFRREYRDQNVRVFWFTPVTPNTLASRFPANTLEDLQGKRIRTYGVMTRALQKIGAAPQSISLPEVYEALNRGVIDGGLTGMELITDLKWYEPAPYVTETQTGLYTLVAVAMNLDTWKSLPTDIQKLFEDEDFTNKTITRSLDFFKKYSAKACDELLRAGATVGIFADEAAANWKKAAAEDLREGWIEEASAHGVDARAFYDEYIETIRRYEAKSTYVSGNERCAARSE